MKKDNFEQIYRNYSYIHKRSLLGLSDMDFKYFIRYKLDIVKKNISGNPKSFLDFGCGIGESSLYISKIFPNTKITGIDTSAFAIEACKKLNIKNSNFYNIDITTEEVLDEKYDVILLICVLHHIPQKSIAKVLKKLLNCLNKNGKIFIFEHNPYNPISLLIFIKSEIDKGCFMVSPRQLKLIIKNLNEQNIKAYPTRYTLFLPRFNFLKKIFFLEKYLEKVPIGSQYYTIIEKIL